MFSKMFFYRWQLRKKTPFGCKLKKKNLNIFLKVPSNIIPTQGLKLYNLRTLATCILKKNARRHKIDCQTRFVCHQIGLERQRCDERDLNAYSFFFSIHFFFLVNFPRFSFIQYMRHLFHLSPLKRTEQSFFLFL